MSSEEDDEEELLQQALAQQAQRDEELRRPAAPAPGLSGLPPPHRSPPPPSKAPPAKPAPKQPPPAAPADSAPPRRAPPRTPPNRAPPPAPSAAMDDDEEESDVEMLSISSDDDTPPPTRRDSAHRGDARAAHGADDESDLEWDEDEQEPDNWKNVDQGELVRRVREMREARTARADAPAARLRRATTIVDAPRGEDVLDPLNLGVINIKTLTLVRDKRESLRNEKTGINEYPTSQEDIPVVRDAALREKVMYHSENFDPKFFLARVHQSTSAGELEAGEGALRVDLQICRDQLKKLVKENFDCSISCKNTIDDIHSKLRQIEADPEGAGTIHLSNSIESVDVVAKRAFGPLLERQAQAERIRSVQGMLQRFRTLFNLPSIIRANISKGEYDLAIREYKKAKSLVQYTHVGILSRVLEEVEKIVQEFKDMLYKTMENPNVDNAQLENCIRLLLELEPDSDPVWYYLSIQDRRIRGLLEGCSLEHEARMDALQGRVQEKAQSDARWKQLQRESNKTSEVDFNILFGDQEKEVRDGQLKELSGEEVDGLLGRHIRRLTAIFVQHVPPFWKLALLIFSGKFVKVSHAVSSNGRQALNLSNEAVMYPFENHTATQHSKHTMDEVEIMILTIISLYETKVLNTFNALADAKELRPYMREALLEITKASVGLQGKDCAPGSAVQALLVLRIDVTRIFVYRLCTLIRGATSELVNEEDWIPVPSTESGGTPYSISCLPLRFRNMLVAAMDHMTEMIQKLSSDSTDLHEDQASIVSQMQDHVKITFLECFLDLAECLERLAGELNEGKPPEESIGAGQSSYGEVDFTGLIPGSEVTNSHQRLLMVLSNTAFCRTTLLPVLSQNYESLWVHSRESEESNTLTTEEAHESLAALEKKLLEGYNQTKAAEVTAAAAAYLVNDGTQWGQCPPIKGVRDNVVELLHPMVKVHAEDAVSERDVPEQTIKHFMNTIYACPAFFVEKGPELLLQVYAGAKPFLDSVTSFLVETLTVALLDVFIENKTKVLRFLDVNGYCQLTLELDFIDAVLEKYFTPTAREAAVGLHDTLLEKVCDSMNELHQAESTGFNSLRSSRGSEDMMDRAGPMSPDDIQAHAHQISVDYLPGELRRARTNVVCFTELVSEYNQMGKRVINLTKSGSARLLLPPSASAFNHPRKSGILGGDLDRLSLGHSSMPPRADYAGSDVGSDTSSRAGSTSDRYSRVLLDSRLGNEPRRASYRTSSSRSYDTDLL